MNIKEIYIELEKIGFVKQDDSYQYEFINRQGENITISVENNYPDYLNCYFEINGEYEESLEIRNVEDVKDVARGILIYKNN